MDTDSFIIHVETEDFYKDIAQDVDKWFDTHKYSDKDKWPFLIGLNKKVLDKFKNELEEKIMTEFIALVAKTYAFLIDEFEDNDYAKNGIVNKKAKGTFDHYKDTLFNNKQKIVSPQRFRREKQTVNTEEVNKTALSNEDDKRLQKFDGITTYPIGRNAYTVCKSALLVKLKERPIQLYY